MTHKQPFSGSKILFSHSAPPLSLLVSSSCSCSPAGRYKPWPYGQRSCSTLVYLVWAQHRDDLAPVQKTCKRPRRVTTAAHGGSKAACAEANRVFPAATSVPRTQSRPLFYGHDKLSWTVKISHSKFWYEAPQNILLSWLTYGTVSRGSPCWEWM